MTLGHQHPFGVFAGGLAGGEQHRALAVVELAVFAQGLDLLLGHHQAQPPLDHVQHLLGGRRVVLHVLGGAPQPGAELAPHLHDFHQKRRQQRVGGDHVGLVDGHDDLPVRELIALRDVVDPVEAADHRDGEVGLVALPGKGGQIDDGDIRLLPGGSGRIEHLAVERVGVHINGLAHVAQFVRFHVGLGLFCEGKERVAHILGQGRPVFCVGSPCRLKNRPTDHAAVGPADLPRLTLLAAGNHQQGHDLQFAHDVPGLVLVVLRRCCLQGIEDRAIDIEQEMGISEGAQGYTAAGFQ